MQKGNDAVGSSAYSLVPQYDDFKLNDQVQVSPSDPSPLLSHPLRQPNWSR